MTPNEKLAVLRELLAAEQQYLRGIRKLSRHVDHSETIKNCEHYVEALQWAVELAEKADPALQAIRRQP